MSKSWIDLTSYCRPLREGWEIPCTVCGDYVGGLVYRSNADHIESHQYWCEWVDRIYEPYNASYLVINRDLVVDSIKSCTSWQERRALVRALRRLADTVRYMVEEYPCLDEHHLSEIELEAVSEAWEHAVAFASMPEWWEDLSDAELSAASEEGLEHFMSMGGRYEHVHGQTYLDDDDVRDSLIAVVRSS